MVRRANRGAQTFLVLLPAAVGCTLGGLILDADGGAGRFATAYLTVALVLALAGVTAPLLGIKKPFRSYRMLMQVSRSPLSRQAVFVGVFAILLLVHWALVLGGIHLLGLAVITAVIGVGAVIAAGFTHFLGAQPAWRHWSTFSSPFASMLALGSSLSLVVALGWRGQGLLEGGGASAARLMVLAGVILLGLGAAAWAVYLRKGGVSVAQTRELALGRGQRGWKWFVSGLLLVVAVAGITAGLSFVTAWLMIVTVLALLAGLFLLRQPFFAAAVPLNWRSEVAWSLPPELVAREG